MKWSWRIGSISGIGIYIHATFPLLLIWAVLAQYQYTGTLSGAIGGVILVLGVIGIVVLHELGHALTARRYGIPTRRITLLPIGGLAELERMPEDPRHELAIAAAGPAVNLGLALVLYAIYLLLGGASGTTSMDPPAQVGLGLPGETFLGTAIWINLWLAAFNLLPAFPMDGGRILRAFLALRLGSAEATAIAARIGKGFAILFAFIGLFVNPILVFIGLFIWIGATSETQVSNLRSALEDVLVEEVMITNVLTLRLGDPLARAIEHILAGFQEDFPVLAGGRVVGMLTRADLVRALSTHGVDAPVELTMQREFRTVSATDPVNAVYPLFREGQRTLPVLHGGELVGLLTLENIAEYVMIRGALGTARGTAARLSDRPWSPGPALHRSSRLAL